MQINKQNNYSLAHNISPSFTTILGAEIQLLDDSLSNIEMIFMQN